MFIAAQKCVRARLEKRWLAAFIASPQFLSRHKSAEVIPADGHTLHDFQPTGGIKVKVKMKEREGRRGLKNGEPV